MRGTVAAIRTPPHAPVPVAWTPLCARVTTPASRLHAQLERFLPLEPACASRRHSTLERVLARAGCQKSAASQKWTRLIGRQTRWSVLPIEGWQIWTRLVRPRPRVGPARASPGPGVAGPPGAGNWSVGRRSLRTSMGGPARTHRCRGRGRWMGARRPPASVCAHHGVSPLNVLLCAAPPSRWLMVVRGTAGAMPAAP